MFQVLLFSWCKIDLHSLPVAQAFFLVIVYNQQALWLWRFLACRHRQDKFGVSWQVTPTGLGEMLRDPDKEKAERVTDAFLKMKKFDIRELKKAYEG